MRRLAVLYDPRCRACATFQRWLASEPAYTRPSFVPWRLAEARRRFPALEPGAGHADLVVVGDRGEVWRGEKAWRMCLWSLRRWRADSASATSTLQALKEHDAVALPGPPPLPPSEATPSSALPWSTVVVAALAVCVVAFGVTRGLLHIDANPTVFAAVLLAFVVFTVLVIQGFAAALGGPRGAIDPHPTSRP